MEGMIAAIRRKKRIGHASNGQGGALRLGARPSVGLGGLGGLRRAAAADVPTPPAACTGEPSEESPQPLETIAAPVQGTDRPRAWSVKRPLLRLSVLSLRLSVLLLRSSVPLLRLFVPLSRSFVPLSRVAAL